MRRAFVAAAIGWAGALPLATWAASIPHAARAWYAAAFVVYGAGSFVCHQLPQRSFYLWATQMPVCARCTGIYAGAALTALASVTASRRAAAGTNARTALVLAAVPTLATLAYEWTTGHVPSNLTRAMAGVPLGGVVAWIVAREPS
jgi:uncharacterized membrane protein